MAINWARSGVFAAGVVLGVVGAAALFAPGEDEAPPPVAEAVPALPPVATGAADCASYKPLVAAAGEGDGQLALQDDVQASSSAVHDFIVQGKEEAAAGRARDAEAAFLMACRGAAALKDDPVPLADAQYQLGRHYAQLASSAKVARRDELLQRSQALYATALAAFRQHRGPDHEKTRFAAEGLAKLQQRMAGAGAAPVTAAAPAEEAAAKEAAAKDAAAKEAAAKEAAAKDAAAKEAAAKDAVAKEAAAKEAAAKEAAAKEAAAKEAAAKEAAARTRQQRETRTAAATPVPERATSKRRTDPSFDCDLARSTTERLICADEDLARQDRELGRLHQRAKQAAADPRAFQRQSDAAWQRREETCRDRECLQRWYAQRRAELSSLHDAQAAAPSEPTTARPPAPAVAEGSAGAITPGGGIPQAEGSAGTD